MAFNPTSPGAKLSVAQNAQSRLTLDTGHRHAWGAQVRVCNLGSFPVYAAWTTDASQAGTVSASAASGSYPVLPNSAEVLLLPAGVAALAFLCTGGAAEVWVHQGFA